MICPLAAPATIRLLTAALLLALAAAPADAAGKARNGRTFVAGPVPAEIVRILDGDTVLVLAMPWPDQHVRVAVRLRGIDAPEMKAKCPREREAAALAQAALTELAGASGEVALYNVSGGKYFGRVLADMVTPAGIHIGPALMERGLVAAYDGGKRKPLVC